MGSIHLAKHGLQRHNSLNSEMNLWVSWKYNGNIHFLDHLNNFNISEKHPIPRGRFVSYFGMPTFSLKASCRTENLVFEIRIWGLPYEKGTNDCIATFNDSLSNGQKAVNYVELGILSIF
jgi:hypothetical protein